MLEYLHPRDAIDIEGEEHLARIHQLNREGKFVIFAPNHLKPSGIRAKLVLTEDYPALDRVLQEHGIRSRVVLKGDTNMRVGDSMVMKALYETHAYVFSRVGRLLSGGITMNLNLKDHDRAIVSNIGSVREMVRTIKEKDNLVIFPYGDWYEPREQTFDDSTDLDGGEAFVSRRNFPAWRKSLKSGFIRMAKRAEVPIVPTYIEKGEQGWIIRFGQMLETADADAITLAKQYLASMRSLRG